MSAFPLAILGFASQTWPRWSLRVGAQGADWAVNGGLFGAVGDIVWAREAEVKHGRICMLAATGAVSSRPSSIPLIPILSCSDPLRRLRCAGMIR